MASVVPAPRPAAQRLAGQLEGYIPHTNEHHAGICLSSFFIRKPPFIGLETGEADAHLGDDAREDSSETLVESEWSFPLHDLCPGRDKTSRFGLQSCLLVHDAYSKCANTYPWTQPRL